MGTNSPKVDAPLKFDSALRSLVQQGPFRCFRHVRRGTSYIEIGRGEVQSDMPIREGDDLVVYLGEDGKLWLRPTAEFDDGRFEPLPKLRTDI